MFPGEGMLCSILSSKLTLNMQWVVPGGFHTVVLAKSPTLLAHGSKAKYVSDEKECDGDRPHGRLCSHPGECPCPSPSP